MNRSDAIATLLAVDPEVFGCDPHDAPRLGCATTGQLITELDARIPLDWPDESGSEPTAQSRSRAALMDFRDTLSGEQLAYRTIDS